MVSKCSRVCAVLLFLSVTGCSLFAAQNARYASIVRDMDALVYNAPCETILQQARTILFERGMSVRDTGGATIETEWALVNESNRTQRRYLILGTTPGPDKCKLQAQSSERSGRTRSVNTKRDYYFELAVLERVDPVGHGRIVQAADLAATAAANQ